MNAGGPIVPVWQRTEVMRRGSSLWKTLWVVGVLSVLFWAAVLVPLYFQPPRAGEICGNHGGCEATSSSDWYPSLAVFSLLFLAIAAGCFYAVLTKFPPRSPTG
jgi:hypothetical protein